MSFNQGILNNLDLNNLDLNNIDARSFDDPSRLSDYVNRNLNNLDARSFDDPSRLSDLINRDLQNPDPNLLMQGLDLNAPPAPDINNDAGKYAEVFKALAQASEGMRAQINPNIPGLLQARPYQPAEQQPMPQQMMPNAYMQMLQSMMNRGY